MLFLINNKSVFLVLAFVLFFQVFPSFAQPTLDPTQTVNPAMGEMGFSLPLATVRGINGHDFPINLNYQAGIRLHQQASPIGLGFSCGGGSITREIIFASDDNIGGQSVKKGGNNP